MSLGNNCNSCSTLFGIINQFSSFICANLRHLRIKWSMPFGDDLPEMRYYFSG
jgi:hypothetical protein